jgi:hypothetical protein
MIWMAVVVVDRDRDRDGGGGGGEDENDGVMSLTSEMLLTNQCPLRYTAAAFSISNVRFHCLYHHHLYHCRCLFRQ